MTTPTLAASLPKPETFTVTLTRVQTLSPSVKAFTFERQNGSPLRFLAGQWVNLHLPLPSGTIKRAYSIASAPCSDATFELAITKVDGGPGSTFIHEMAIGTTLEITGPQGLFLRQHQTPSLFVGTGTGITPLRSMFRAALDAGEQSPIHVIFGVREEADRIYAEEFETLEQKHPNFHVQYTLSRATDAWQGKRGYVQTHVREAYEALSQPGAECHVYICGLQKMIEQVRHLLRQEMQLPRQLVHSERYD
jgi:CDP-4-dehydro-6-deoxyglucose reductase, E3